MLLDLVQPFLRAEVSLELAEIYYTLMVSITRQSLGFGLFTTPSPNIPSLHRLKRSIIKPFTLLAAFSCAT